MQSNKVLYWLNTGIFPATVMFSCGFNYSEIEALLKKKKADEWLFGVRNQKLFIEKSNYCAYSIEIKKAHKPLSSCAYLTVQP